MTAPQQPRWMVELIGIVGQLCPPSASGEGADPSAPSSWKERKVGRVTRDARMDAGWFWIGLNGRALDDDEIEAAYLAPQDGAAESKFSVIESVQEGNVLRVRVAEHAPTTGLYLYAPRRPKGQLYISLRDGLSSISRFDLVSQFAEGRADAVPVTGDSSGGPARLDELNEEQRTAWNACCAPGVHLIWGPPGTGKTRVIAEALQSLMASGKSALLVSGTNIAVDNALARAVAAIKPRPGEMIRAGNPHLAEIAENPDVCLQKLVQDRQITLEKERDSLSASITALKADPAFGALEASEAALSEYDPSAYRAAYARLESERSLISLLAAHSAVLADAGAAAASGLAADARLQALIASDTLAAPARQHLMEAERMEKALGRLRHDAAMTSAAASRFEAERDRLIAERGGRRFAPRAVKAEIRENAELLRRAVARRDDAASLLASQAPYLTSEIASHVALAAPHTAASIAALDSKLAAARHSLAEIAATRQALARRVASLAASITELQERPLPSPLDRSLVAQADAAGLPVMWEGLGGLRSRASDLGIQIARLESRHEQVLTRMREEGIAVRREIVENARVVAATLAMLRMRPELRDRDYSCVIVDEVSFAPVPDVIFAVSRATSGVTLLGDFLQNGPIAPEELGDSDDDTVRRWYFRDSFEFFGITDADSAMASKGCTVLTKQYRFGPVITELANTVAYRGILEPGDPDRDPASSPDPAEVVLVDVDGLGDELAGIRPGPKIGKWWPVGALLAQALAGQAVRQALDAGKPASNKAGVVVPYRAQLDIVKDVLNESGANPQIEAGTSHRFQGREFDTVIFDLVEDGKGWVARGDLTGGRWAAGGLRMFNVGITRARQRLYLIANMAIISKAKGGPLHAIAQLIDTGKVHVVRAATVLGLPSAPADDPAASELWHALRGHATLIDLYDEENLPDELARRIDAADKAIWLWSPWVGQRSEQLMPHLLAARDRGVRVHPVVLPRDEVTRHLKPRHEELAAEIPATVYLRNEHQKIVLIDDNLAFLGSMNVLAHRPGSRLEVMALFQSRTLVTELMAHERTAELASPPTCPRCGSPVRLARVFRADGRPYWHCESNLNGTRCDWRTPFADHPGARNQPKH